MPSSEEEERGSLVPTARGKRKGTLPLLLRANEVTPTPQASLSPPILPYPLFTLRSHRRQSQRGSEKKRVRKRKHLRLRHRRCRLSPPPPPPPPPPGLFLSSPAISIMPPPSSFSPPAAAVNTQGRRKGGSSQCIRIKVEGEGGLRRTEKEEAEEGDKLDFFPFSNAGG